MVRAVRGRLFVDGALREGTLLLADDGTGTIAGVAGPARADEVASEGTSSDVLDVGDHWVLPSATDIHVHLREPGHAHKETIADGTAAAARGGVTAVYDMPNTDPPTDGVAAFDDKAKRVTRRAVVDVGIYAAPPPAGEAFDDRLLAKAAAVKLYLSETSHVGGVDWERVPDVLAWARGGSRVLAVHAEDPDAFTDDPDHWRARPPEAETRAVEAVLKANEGVGADVHIAHATLASTLDRAPSAECAPHHLLLDVTAFDDLGAYAKTNPPLREADHREALWDAFLAGDTLLASDHAPHTREEKEGDDPPSGVPGVETMVPLFLARAKAGDVPLSRVVEATCEAPAERFGRDAGRLAPGCEASFMVVDPDAVAPVRADELRTLCGWTPFEGMDALFPRDVHLRGEPVVERGEVVGGPGRARVLGGSSA